MSDANDKPATDAGSRSVDDARGAEKDTQTGVDRLLSRFGPVPEIDPNRDAPGPRPGSAGLERPGPRPTPGPTPGASGTSSDRPPRARLFDEPHDEVFGDTMVRVSDSIAVDQDISVLTSHEPIEVIDRRDWARMPRRTGPAFRFLVVALVVGLGAAFIYGRATTWYDDQLNPPGEPGPALDDEFTISSGATSNEVTQDLYARNVIAQPTLFRYWLQNNFEGGEFQAGDYDCLMENMSFDEALGCLKGGPIPPSFFSVTVREGRTLEEIIDELASYGFDEESLRADLGHALVTVSLTGVPPAPFPDSPDPTGSGKEGLLFPATYQVDVKQSNNTLDILVKMAQTMQQRFEAASSDGRDAVIDELELTEYEVLTIASLIEEEARVPEDRPKIARVIYNRLLRGEPLGIDATACYAAQVPCAGLEQVVLDNPSEWNTRAPGNLGLPPTPIAAPGEASIRAALQPDAGEWIFYVRTEEDGGHTFATTNEEFLAAKAICQERQYC